MKKVLFGFLVALIAFTLGISTSGLFNFGIKTDPKVEITPLPQKVKIEEVPIIKSESINKLTESETNEKAVIEDNYGWYQLDDNPKTSDLGMILLSSEVEENADNPRKAKIVSSAGIFTEYDDYGDQGFVGSAWAEINNKKAKFRTKKINGFEYRFEGTFFKNKTSGKEGEKVLRGTLQKFKKGKKIAEAKGDYAYYEPQCWH